MAKDSQCSSATRRALLAVALVVSFIACNPSLDAEEAEMRASRASSGLTLVEGLKVGHYTYSQRPTGCTVVLAEAGAVASVDVRGGAPATRETDLLRPENLVQEVHAVVLSGGSAYGLDSAGGVMKYLEEKEIGFPVRGTVVPIVVGASLLDLGVGGIRPRPDAECGYKAAVAATSDDRSAGNIGAGAGATVGKFRGLGRGMKGGLGQAAIETSDGLVVAALAAVNAAGDVVDPATGRVVAGVRGDDGSLLDVRRLLLEDRPVPPSARDNTTLVVVGTNARLTKTEAHKVAQMAHDGMARAIVPSHTPGDGDTIFTLATGKLDSESDVGRIGALAAEATAAAIVAAVRAADGIEGFPAARDLER